MFSESGRILGLPNALNKWTRGIFSLSVILSDPVIAVHKGIINTFLQC
jgi:hypothetical protein